MTIYQDLLRYYLSSEQYFQMYVSWFWDSQYHVGECGPKSMLYLSDFTSENRQKNHLFYSDKYLWYKEKDMREYGQFRLELPDESIQHYFTANFQDTQLFAVIFGHWWELREGQIKQISNHMWWRHSWEVLNYFICNPTEEHPRLSIAKLRQNEYTGPYFIEIDGSKIPARREGGRIIRQDTKEAFIIQ